MNQTGRLAFLRGPKGLGEAFFLLFFFLMGRWVDSGSLIFSAGGLVASGVGASGVVASGVVASGLVASGLVGGGLVAGC